MDEEFSPASSAQASSTVCVSVVEAIANAEGVDPFELPHPLGDVIDVDALDRLVSQSQQPNRITFCYEGYDVTVRSDGRISVR